MSCFRCLILAKSVFDWIGNNLSRPKTNCPGEASNAAALRKGPQGSFVSSSLILISNVLSALPSTT